MRIKAKMMSAEIELDLPNADEKNAIAYNANREHLVLIIEKVKSSVIEMEAELVKMNRITKE